MHSRSFTLSSEEYSMPVLGQCTDLCVWVLVGTYQLSNVAGSIEHAIQLGYRHIDTAAFYRNEKAIGDALKDIFARKVISRSEIFVTTKLWYSEHGYDLALKAFDESYKKLGLEYVDLYLIHWPGTNYDDPDTNQKLRKETWRALEKLVKDGKVRSIGVSNYTIKHLEELLSYCEIKPAVNQVEFHPKLYQKDLLKFCNDHNIILQAYSSLAKGALLKDKLVQEIAKTYSRSASQILLRWGIQHNLVVIPKSSGPDRMKENFNLDFEISPEDMDRMDALDEDWHCTWDPTNIP